MLGTYVGLLGLSGLLLLSQRSTGRRRVVLAAVPLAVLTFVGLVALVLAVVFVVQVNRDCERTPSCRSSTLDSDADAVSRAPITPFVSRQTRYGSRASGREV